MNVALPAIIVFLLLLPGFIFRTRLKRADRTSLDFSPFGQIAAEAVLWAILAHLFWLTISYVLFRYRVEPIVLIKLLSSAPASQVEATNEVAKNTRWISAYFISLLLASFSIPTMIRSLISRFRLDRLASPFSSVFRFHEAPWYYLLTGADFSHEEAPDFIVVSAIVEVAKEAVLYVGVLDEFVVDSGGQLDRLVLQGVVRRPIENDKPKPGSDHTDDVDRFYKIDGDSFVLRYSEAITLNVQYVKLTADGVIADRASE
ncbi:hypothetical protein Q4S45_13175 [Massilia sp. R2A-15]|uniref:hypothetical protein n=1 Tax=Massilia sp. R2A-15 TaxID=3064278 RepID=UPI002736A8F2|nr:hypothetical protein [Massilia sp. R2A-15]WLI87693.1 hypothetical protein Q4S45_13175 [Massilia sp. R2A-15]